MSSSILPHAAARWAGSLISAAFLIASLIALSLSNGQLELFVGTIESPLNGTCRMDCGSLKSLIHPTFGHTFGSFFTTSQNFVYIVSVVTNCTLTLNPSCESWSLTTAAVLFAGGSLEPTIVIEQSLPVHFPLGKPAFFM